MEEKSNILIIPRHLVTVRFMDIPSLDNSEIGKIVRLQAIKEIPYPKEEMVISYRNLGSYKDGFSSIMLVIAKKEIVNEKLREGSLRGLEAENIRLHTEVVYLSLLKGGILDSNKVTLVIHMGREDSEIMIIDKKKPVFSRGFKNNDRFLEEIDRSMLVYKRDGLHPEVENILVAYPSMIDVEHVRQYLKDFKIPVNFHEYSDDLTDSNLSLEIDLLPEELTLRKKKAKERQEHLVTYSLIGLVVILCFAFFALKIHEKKRLLEMLSSKTVKMQIETDQIGKYRKKIDLVIEHRKQGKFIIDTLEHSYSLIPPDISLSRLSYNEEEGVFYKGASESTSSIFGFVKRLEKSEYFDRVEIKHTAKKNVKLKEVTEFDVQCHLNTDQ
ncbi:MAG: PilN domain-containing protein [Candidatus Omnitrophica bacterium]|nr:PilN domain-containing protein [Candidatus Omnitrophota bacterium]